MTVTYLPSIMPMPADNLSCGIGMTVSVDSVPLMVAFGMLPTKLNGMGSPVWDRSWTG
jgi:hypothetical protein